MLPSICPIITCCISTPPVILACSSVSALLMQAAESMHSAAERGDLEALQRLAEAGADVNERDAEGLTPLHWAADHGHVQVSQPLTLSCGCAVMVMAHS